MIEKYLWISIGLELNYNDIFNTSLVCKKFLMWLWSNDNFWKLRFIKKYGTLNIYPNSWRQCFIDFSTKLTLYSENLNFPQHFMHIKQVFCAGSRTVFLSSNDILYTIQNQGANIVQEIHCISSKILSNCKCIKCSFEYIGLLTNTNDLYVYDILNCNTDKFMNVDIFSIYGKNIVIVNMDGIIDFIKLSDLVKIHQYNIHNKIIDIVLNLRYIYILTIDNLLYIYDVDTFSINNMLKDVLLFDSKYDNTLFIRNTEILFNGEYHYLDCENLKKVICGGEIIAYLHKNHNLNITGIFPTRINQNFKFIKDVSLGYKQTAILTIDL